MASLDSRASSKDAAEKVLRHLARRSIGLTGAEVEHLVRQARQSARRERRSFVYADMEKALTAIRPAKPDYIRIRLAFHEAAHAVAHIRLGLGQIALITIDAPEGGYVRYHKPVDIEATEELMTAHLVAGLAGRAAEEEVFETTTAGSGAGEHSDLARATKLAFDMETTFGFAQEMPLVYRGGGNWSDILNLDRQLIARVNARLENAYDAARKLVVARMDAIKFLSGALMVKGTLEGAELDALVARVRKLVTDPKDTFRKEPEGQAESRP